MINKKTNFYYSVNHFQNTLQAKHTLSPACFAAYLSKAVVFSVVLALMLAIVFPINAYAAEDRFGVSRTNLLRTSYNPNRYSLFQADGDTIYARGKYADDRIKKIFIPNYEDAITGYKMSIEGDGSYEAEITCSTTMEYECIAIELNSGEILAYEMCYDKGWFFPDNGLSDKNRKVFDNITNASPESVGYYMSETADAYEIEVVKEQIKLISDSVVDGIESDYEKARALCRYVADHFYYDCDARDTSVTESNVALLNILKTSKTICIGFADLYCALLQAQGIDAVNIVGGSTGLSVDMDDLPHGVQNHEFTAFFYEAENRWVWVDSCWCGSGEYRNGEYIEDNTHEKYFDISDEALAADHRADYAQRRDFFNAKASEKVATQTTSNTEPIELTMPHEKSVTSAATSEPPEEITEEQEKEPAQSDDTVLYIIAAVLGAAVLAVLIALIKITRKKP